MEEDRQVGMEKIKLRAYSSTAEQGTHNPLPVLDATKNRYVSI
jgi:hypothetical protein